MEQQLPDGDTRPPTEAPRGRRMRAGIVAAGAAFGMTLAGLGISAAQTDDPTPTPPGAIEAPDLAPGFGFVHKGRGGGGGLSAAAEAIGMTDVELATALRDGKSIADVAKSKNVGVQKVIDAMVADASAKLDERKAALPAQITARVNQAGGFGPKAGRGGPGRHGHRGPGIGADLSVAAKAIGVTNIELMTALREGKSIADVAKSKNVDVQKVIDALVADTKTKLAALVTAGRLTQAEADQKASNLTDRITTTVNRARKGPRLEAPKAAPSGSTTST